MIIKTLQAYLSFFVSILTFMAEDWVDSSLCCVRFLDNVDTSEHRDDSRVKISLLEISRRIIDESLVTSAPNLRSLRYP